MNFQTMSKQRKFILIASAAGIVSIFLPWVRISILGFTENVNGFHGNGILVFFCFAACAIIAYLGDQTKNLDKTMWAITLIAGALAALIVIWDIMDANRNPFGNFLGFGIYISALAGVGIVLAAFLFRSATDSLRSGFDSLKHDIESKIKTNTNTTYTGSTGNSNYTDANTIQRTPPVTNNNTVTDINRTITDANNLQTGSQFDQKSTDLNPPL